MLILIAVGVWFLVCKLQDDAQKLKQAAPPPIEDNESEYP